MSKTVKVAIMGSKAAFHDIAADKFFGAQQILVDSIEHTSFDKMLNEVDEQTYGIMAIENSLSAGLDANFERLRTCGLQIHGQVSLRISLNLCGLPGASTAQLKTVQSHPMAIKESSTFFASYPQIEMIEGTDTAGSAKYVAGASNVQAGAICSKKAAALYGLEVLETAIENHSDNYTRFLVLSKANPKPLADNAEASLLCTVVLDPARGEISSLLNSTEGVNVRKLVALPGQEARWAYRFFVECTGELVALRAFSKAARIKLSELEVLGIYPEGNTFEE